MDINKMSDLQIQIFLLWPDCLVGLVVKASTSRVEDPGSIPACGVGIFQGRVIPVN